MFRLRLFYGLLTIILLLWAVGAAALLLMRDSAARFDRLLREDYRVIDAAQSIRTLTATINSHYAPLLAGPPPARAPDRALYDSSRQQLGRTLAFIQRNASQDPRFADTVARLEQGIDSYSATYDHYFDGTATSREERQQVLQDVSSQTQRLTDLSENVRILGAEKLFSGARRIRDEGGKNTLFVVTLVLLGTSVAILVYFQLVRHVVDPVAILHQSMQEVRKGNFELTLPVPSAGSEFSQVVTAFNAMAAELRLRRSETNDNLLRANLVNRAILESIPSPVFVLSDDSSIVQINPAAERLSERLGLSGRLPVKIQNILDECRKTSAHFLPEDPREALLFRIEEREFYYLPRIFRFDSEGTHQSGWAIMLHNVTRIRWLDDMKTNLIATVSHEIKTPLTGIRMVLQLLQEDRNKTLDDMQRTMLASASDDCERLLLTLNGLLDLSRAESGATQLSCVSVPLETNVQRVAELYRVAAATKNVDIRIEKSAADLPQVLADPIRLDEVLNNLISNAIKHSPAGRPVLMRLARPDADHLRVSVIDQGPGVPAASQSRIFERFYRAPGQSDAGVGLGLFISREIMRAHEGRIGLSERTNDQTEFFIDVPIA
jgi:signal transduction histidine kinase